MIFFYPRWTILVLLEGINKELIFPATDPSIRFLDHSDPTRLYLDVPLEVSKRLGSVGYSPNIRHS